MRKIAAVFLALLLILSIWIMPCDAAGADIDFSPEELAFMEAHPVIRLGVDPGFVPFEFINEDGEYAGITADYLALISEKTGLRFEVEKGLTWPQAYDMALAGDVDMLPAVGKTEERAEHFLFSKPYYYFKRVIVTRDTDTGITGMNDLFGLTVAVQKNSSHHSYLLSYPKINLSLYDSVEAALTAVATGTERAFVGNLATTNYLIRTNGLTNLRFVSFEAEKQQALYFAVRRDWPELIGIFNKALDAIPEGDKLAINNKWIDLNTDIDYGPMIRALSMVGVLIAAAMGVSFFWIIRLKKEIVQRQQIQEDLERAKQVAVEASEFKSSFLARMSHEIRTPLNAITGMAYLLKKTNLTLTQKTYADRITQASSNMLNIINDILDYSKIEAGKVELEIETFSMDQVILDVVNIVSYKIDEQGIGFKLTKDPHLPNWFFGDSKRIEQVLLNILNNAAKFTAKGEVSLDIRLDSTENEFHRLAFTVKDTGIGMSEEQLAKLFSPFIQGDSSINRRFGGSGLGLSIVKSLVELMGGQIQVFSAPGEGSTFIILLPLRVDIDKESVYIKTLQGNHLKNLKTLVLGKTGSDINLIESCLSAFGMGCALTTSKVGAQSMLEGADGKLEKPFDLLIVDCETPGECGFEFIKSIQSSEKIPVRPKIIILLPMMREDLFDKLSDYGIDIGIGKPVIPSVLLNGILDIFKLKAVSATEPCKTAAPVRLSKRYTVLVAEDNKTNQLIAKSLLQQIGVESILAGDGREAVELYGAFKDKIALILMDLHMPRMNGYEAAAEIKKLSKDVPIVAMTADVILGVKEKCEEQGIHHYISKPFDPDRFLETVRELILAGDRQDSGEPPELDEAAGLKNMGGNAKLYRQVLEEYSRENQDTPERLSRATEEKRYADASQLVHKIKSSSGSIGATSLYELSVKLQNALDNRETDEIECLQKDFIRKLKGLLEEITKIKSAL